MRNLLQNLKFHENGMAYTFCAQLGSYHMHMTSIYFVHDILIQNQNFNYL